MLVVLFGATIVLPLLETLSRATGLFHINGSAGYLKHLVLWLCFLGGLLATRERKQLQLSTAEFIPEGNARAIIRVISQGVGAAICLVLAYASWLVVEAHREGGKALTIGLPEWISELIMPAALIGIALHMIWQAGGDQGPGVWQRRGLALLIAPLGVLLDFAPGLVGSQLWLLIGVIVLCAALGTPVFLAMAGVAMLLFFEDGTSVSAVSAEVYRLVASPTLPAIPLLTACGYILAETRAAERLVRFFRALFGWMPGGIALLAVAVCAVFTTFTGGSGVTIIALGGLVFGIMREDGYPEGFSHGLITASGSLGLLFPPSLPVILYAVVVSASPEFKVAADDLYIAGLVPGMLLIVLVGAYAVFKGRRLEKNGQKESPGAQDSESSQSWTARETNERSEEERRRSRSESNPSTATLKENPNKRSRIPFDFRELLASAWGAKWELSVPVIVVVLFVSGIASMVEAAASAAAYALFVEVVITKDIHPTRDLPGILVKAGVLVGAVLILLSAAMGLSSFVLVEAEVPEKLLGWVQGAITEPWVFLLALNILLIVLGCLMEIYSAIVILPPILAPIAAHYGVDPLHLGVIFLANLELGFISPPIGLNLFLAASRFEIPMARLYKQVVPYLLIMGGGVMLITYVPAMSVGVVEWLRPAKTAPKTPKLKTSKAKDKHGSHHLAPPAVQQVAADARPADRSGHRSDDPPVSGGRAEHRRDRSGVDRVGHRGEGFGAPQGSAGPGLGGSDGAWRSGAGDARSPEDHRAADRFHGRQGSHRSSARSGAGDPGLTYYQPPVKGS